MALQQLLTKILAKSGKTLYVVQFEPAHSCPQNLLVTI